MKRAFLTLAAVALLLGGVGQANADFIQTFDLAWSGVSNTATATGQITLDLSLMQNPGTTYQSSSGFVEAFSITISGATSGNGTFGFSDYTNGYFFGGFLFATGGGPSEF